MSFKVVESMTVGLLNFAVILAVDSSNVAVTETATLSNYIDESIVLRHNCISSVFRES